MSDVTAPEPVIPVIVLIDGLTRSGKGLLGPVLSSFERVELERIEPDLEWMGDLWRLGRVQTDAAVAFLRLAVNRLGYEGMVGRNTNFRFGDHSSVWQSPRRLQYFRRLFMDERLPLLERISSERPIFQNMVHHQLMNFALFDAAFKDRLRMIEMIRHPVDLVDSWMRKRKGELIGKDPLISMVFIEWRQHFLPWYAQGWEAEYLAATPIDRVIRLISAKWRMQIDGWHAVPIESRNRLLVLPLEDFTQRPEPYLRRLADFVGTGPTEKTPKMLRQQRVPRTIDTSRRNATRDDLLKRASPDARVAFEAMILEHASLVPSITL